MRLLKNRTILGIICIVLSLLICFAVTPLFNSTLSQKAEIIRVIKDINAGDQISADEVKIVEVGSYNLPENVVKDEGMVVGEYATADMCAGDYILSTKLTDSPAAENLYLYRLDGEKQAISITIKNFAEGLSGKLVSGDIVSVIAPDYKEQGTTIIPSELKYVEVIGVTASTGFDTDVGEQTDTDEKSLPTTVTLLVSPEQSKILAELESAGTIHLSLVYRGSSENATEFIQAQDALLANLYPAGEADDGEPSNENGVG